MSLLSVLENGLFALGQVLRFPVMALLWVCVGAALFMAGSSVMEFVARRRERSDFRIETWLRQGTVLTAPDSRMAALPPTLRKLAAEVNEQRGTGRNLEEGALEHLVMESEERLRSLLTGPRALVKVGPSLGLLGTLIPMGTSLASLAAGNLEAMAGQMIVAFTTTIIGLATGTLAYAVSVIRQAWVNQDVREQRFFAERIASELAAPEREFAGRR